MQMLKGIGRWFMDPRNNWAMLLVVALVWLVAIGASIEKAYGEGAPGLQWHSLGRSEDGSSYQFAAYRRGPWAMLSIRVTSRGLSGMVVGIRTVDVSIECAGRFPPDQVGVVSVADWDPDTGQMLSGSESDAIGGTPLVIPRGSVLARVATVYCSGPPPVVH